MKTTKVKVSLVEHRGEQRLKIEMGKDYDHEAANLIRQIAGRTWSKTMGCWHIPQTMEAFEQLKSYFEVELDEAGRTQHLVAPFKEKKSQHPVQVTRFASGWLKVEIDPPSREWEDRIAGIAGSFKDEHEGCWVVPSDRATRNKLEVILETRLRLKSISSTPKIENKRQKKASHYDPLPPSHLEALSALGKYLILNRYSQSTIKSYKYHFQQFLIVFRGNDLEEVTKEDIENYIYSVLKKRKISESTQSLMINSIKFYYEKVLGRPKKQYKITRPKKPLQLPNVLSHEEVVALINSCSNIKHKCIMVLVYSAGLRLSEVVQLRVRDINKDRRTIFIKGGKGKKDRYTILAENVIPILKHYQKQYQPNYWLFEGLHGGQYSKRSVQQIFTRAKEESMINPFATVHTLRHSFATHCLEAGYSTAMIQEILGHASIATTERYLHISNTELRKLRSPLDELEL